MAKQRQSKKAKRPDTRPARKRYWMKRTLELRKVKHLIRYCGMTTQSAYKRWHKDRQGRVPTGFLPRTVEAE